MLKTDGENAGGNLAVTRGLRCRKSADAEVRQGYLDAKRFILCVLKMASGMHPTAA